MEKKEKKEKKKGRPKKEKEKLSCSINLKLTEEDLKKVRERAEKLGLKVTQYARQMVLNGRVKSRFTLEELDLIRKLSGMANNLNQIAKKANQAGFKPAERVLIQLVREITKLLDDR